MTILLTDFASCSSKTFTSFSMNIDRVKRVRTSFSLPLVSVHVDIGKTIVLSLSQVWLFGGSSLDVFHLENVSMGNGSSLLGL